MSIDFLKFLSPEARQRVLERQDAYEKRCAEARSMTIQQLCEHVELCLSQTEFANRYVPGEPVYDGAIAHVLIPEMIRRLRSVAEPDAEI